MSLKEVAFFIYILLDVINAVDLDYYYSSALRSQKLECLDSHLQLDCQVQCGLKSALCIKEDCYCMYFTHHSYEHKENNFQGHEPTLNSQKALCRNYTKQLICQKNCGTQTAVCVDDSCFCMTIIPDIYNVKEIDPDEEIQEFEIDDENNGEPVQEESSSELSYAYRPTLRHHIAHFCPNLDKARECIRKCIPLGKPAFCGKDHVCYCGHQYEHSKDTPDDSKKIYAEFKDMYEKYFGKKVSKDLV